MKCEKCKKYIKKYYSSKQHICHNCYHKIWRDKNKDKMKLYYIKHIKKFGHKFVYKHRKVKRKHYLKLHNIHVKKYLEKRPEIKQAYIITKNIIIPKNQLCELCKKNKAQEKHHPDYSKPYKIKFLCIKCHKSITPKAGSITPFVI